MVTCLFVDSGLAHGDDDVVGQGGFRGTVLLLGEVRGLNWGRTFVVNGGLVVRGGVRVPAAGSGGKGIRLALVEDGV